MLGLDLAHAAELLAGDVQADVGHHAQAERLGLHLRGVAADHATLFERAHAAKALRRRQVHLRRQLDVGGAAVGLQGLENLAIDGVECLFWHDQISVACNEACAADCSSRNNWNAHFAASCLD